MKKTTITVTEAARNFADCVNRVHYQNQSFVLLKNGKPVAKLVPETDKMLHWCRFGEGLGGCRTDTRGSQGVAQ